MIVRVSHDGDYDVPDDVMAALAPVDDALHDAVVAGDEAAFHANLEALVGAVHAKGIKLPDDLFRTFDGLAPARDATLVEAQHLIDESTIGA